VAVAVAVAVVVAVVVAEAVAVAGVAFADGARSAAGRRCSACGWASW
jgi:hypothetical protein